VRRPDGLHRGGEGGAGARQLLPAALATYWQVHREIGGDLYPFGLTTPQYLVLVHLVASRREAGMRQLAQAGRHDAATMTAVVDGLVRRGWVVRRRAAADRRRVVVRLTPKGRRTYQLATRRLILRWRRALRTFSGVEQLQLLSLLLRLLEALQDTTSLPARGGPRRLASP
jgi:DNA-binding MarR family transcriptional regulator